MAIRCPRCFRYGAAVAALLVLTLAGCAGKASSGAPAGAPSEASPQAGARAGGGRPVTRPSDWKAIEALVAEQKFQAAADAVGELRLRAQDAGSAEEWTRALVEEVQLTAALGGVETAVRLLREAPWPEDAISQAVLRLLYAHSLARYLDTYGWEIAQRERVAGAGDTDLKQWTRSQVVSAADRAYADLWAEREAWGQEPAGVLGDHLIDSDYPARIRGTLRDAVTYLWVDFLANSSYWEPEEGNTVYRLNLGALAAGEALTDDEGGHPLTQLAAVLGDLERWHLASRRPEAALEAALERLRRLGLNVTGSTDRELLEAHLGSALDRLGDSYPWWSVGQADLARWVQSAARPGSLVAARKLARAGRQAHPGTLGGKRCANLVALLEAPAFTLEAMSSDGADRRSLLVRHKNLETVHFRAYRLDLAQVLERGEDYNLLPARQQVEQLLARSQPSASWQVELPETPDLRSHKSYVEPPFSEPGLYVIAASARADFATRNNRVQALNFVLSDLVVLAQAAGPQVRVDVRSGATGEALAGVEVDLLKLEFRSGHKRVASARTGDKGRVEFGAPSGQRVDAVAIARRGEDVAFRRVNLGPRRHSASNDTADALIYTDRSIYRPQQEVLWKIVAYDRTDAGRRLAAAPKRQLTVELLDANWEVVASEEVVSNDFGSASGRFAIPSGKLLGAWQLRTSLGGQVEVQVEEYKRPTFEVTLVEPEEALRLNRPATLSGEAGYYFGLPVVEGTVEWRVSRRPRYPEWWGWFRPVPGGREELVAGGTTGLDAAGRFELTFLPEADEREAKNGVSYSYAVTVDVTDPGGETRSAERTYRLGYVTIEGRIRSASGFAAAEGSPTFEFDRMDLDGTPRAGTGRWRLVSLESPAQVFLPADEPVVAADDETYRTLGDSQRSRWNPNYRVAGRLRTWEDGATVAEGALEHDGEGRAELVLSEVSPGAHRLYYETEDPFGATFETQHEFLVAGSTSLALPAVLEIESSSVPVGETARLLVHSGLAGQQMLLEIARPGQKTEERRLTGGGSPQVVELPIDPQDRNGIQLRLTALRDHQLLSLERRISVPPEARDLRVRFASFRDLLRPGSRERWRVVVEGPDEGAVAANSAEILAYMYDRSLDLFAQHNPTGPQVTAGPSARLETLQASLGASRTVLQRERDWYRVPQYPPLSPARLRFYDSYGIGGPGRRTMLRRLGGTAMMEAMPATQDRGAVEQVASPAPPAVQANESSGPEKGHNGGQTGDGPPPGSEPLRSDFSETAFWEPHLVTDDEGAVAFEFTVPDSVTDWNVWLHALTRELRYGSLSQQVRTSKELLVRPYLPRFLREGDQANIQVVVQNAGAEAFNGTLDLDLLDPTTDTTVAADFGLTLADRQGLAFALEPGGSATLSFALSTPKRVGEVALRVVGEAGDFSDGELRPLPLLPGRFHLAQSRFAALQGKAQSELVFADLAANDDPTRIDEQLVVTLDGQLFYSVLNALPYLIDYPYECTEQTLNRFLSTGIVGSVFEDYPAVAAMAAELAERETPLAPWAIEDPNRRMALEETPWLRAAAGGEADERLLRVLDPRIARAQRDAALAKLAEAQTSLGGFPWWPGGPPSPYMTLYVANGLSRALEFGVEVPEEMVVRAWQYLHRHYLDELADKLDSKKVHHEVITYINYVLSNYPDASWTAGVFSEEDRGKMLDHSFRHWRDHSPLLKSYLTLTLQRANRGEDALLVFDSVMDSAKTTEEEGTFWAPEDRAWLWYNDTIETHAFALRTLGEVNPDDSRRQGLVHWLMLNKKLNHWKSTRATAEVIYSLVHFLAAEGELGAREVATVRIGPAEHEFVFEPDEYTGAHNQVVVAGSAIDPATDSTVIVEKETPGLMFASATWHFSTEELPLASSGDFFAVERTYFKRQRQGDEWTLQPLAEGASVAVGDQVEVHVSLGSRHTAEYVHLRDPRPAGFEPESVTSSFKWDLGIGWYEQIRDSGTDFFFEALPVGEYGFKYRLRANLAGTFRAAPATVQSMYAPEFNAYSSGSTLAIEAADR